MKINQCLLSIFVFAISCHSPNDKHASVQLIPTDTTKAVPPSNHGTINDTAFVPKTHLKDTTYAAGSFILFLRPDDVRYAELEKETDEGAGDGDADFGAGISDTEDSLKQNDRYKYIKVLTSANRYICIKDCQDGPLTIDRDSVSYGFILSSRGRSVDKIYNSVHSGNYLREIDDYFSIDDP